MAKLSATFEWAMEADIGVFRQAVRTAGLAPLRAIGSGGSLTAAHTLAAFHQQFTGRLAAVATPLEAVGEPLDPDVGSWLLSAGGGNVDILAAARALIGREPRQLAVLCGRQDSPLAELCRAHPFADLFVYPPPAGKDGFLATNSLFGFATLLARSYAIEFKAAQHWTDAVASVRGVVDEHSELLNSWEAVTASLWSRQTILVLHAPATRVGAIDLESKFTEAALGNLQLADYRNFAHGRHHWLAKRAGVSAVLAFVTDADRALAERTLALIPPNVPQARLSLPGNATATALIVLLAALRITGWAGVARGIDPGRPGVPEFGRRLYNLSLPRAAGSGGGDLSPRDAVAIARKAGMPPDRLAAAGELDGWRTALDAFRDRLSAARFAGAIFDYDGTLVDTRDRFRPPPAEMASELIRLAEGGAWIAIATGRGASARRDLQACLPRAVWDRILVGYYNGAEIARLDDAGAPDGRAIPCESLSALAAALRAQPELARAAQQIDRAFQITLEAARLLPESRLWDLAHQVILFVGATDVSVTRSSHSIDIDAAGVSKLNVVAQLRELAGDAPILAVGDRGRWPGNDYELLREPFSLGVDEISVDPATCWNLAEPGQRGPAATLDYLRSLEAGDGGLRLPREAPR
jgi:hydroxymethylpyrimidine pyrophosphatase-like HAD family hydrolase/fructoselysine-6-P-deglycase FrlB-like protein